MTHAPAHDLQLTKAESEYAERIAKLKGISVEDAAMLVIKRSLEDRVKKRTGKSPAKVYPMRKAK